MWLLLGEIHKSWIIPQTEGKEILISKKEKMVIYFRYKINIFLCKYIARMIYTIDAKSTVSWYLSLNRTDIRSKAAI